MANAIISRTFKSKDILVAQETGSSETAVMSQKAVTDKFNELETAIGIINDSLEARLNGE